MKCNWIKAGDVQAIVCGARVAAKCEFCGAPATRQCDARRGAKTCDRYICARCAQPAGTNRDFCPEHRR